MEAKPIVKTEKDKITPEKKVDIPLSSVKFSKRWAFWESYSAKSKTEKIISYDETNKQIFNWSDLITFFQFWNKYPGKDFRNIFFDGNNVKFFFEKKYRINSMNIFQEGIKPMWEDEKNKGGNYYQLDYQVQKDRMEEFAIANKYWKKLALSVMGGSLPYSEYINGIRFIDKTDFERGRIIMFRFEVWVNKDLKDIQKLEDLKQFLSKNYGCENVNMKKITL